MGVTEDIEASLKEMEVTPIQGQPADPLLTQLPQEQLTNIATSDSTGLGGGKNGHTEVITKRDKYITVSHNAIEFIVPGHPGAYPSNVSDKSKMRARAEAEHNAKVKE